MPKDYNNYIHVSLLVCISYNNENVYFRWFNLCVQNVIKLYWHVSFYNNIIIVIYIN